MSFVLAADIGGTNSRFGLFSLTQERQLTLQFKVWLETQEATSFPELFSMLLDAGLPVSFDDITAATFAVPGAVFNHSMCIPPNIPWKIDLAELPHLRDKSLLINDFAAQAFACQTEAVQNALVLQEGIAKPKETIAVIGAGTGLGYAALIHEQGHYHAVPSEAGHMAFPFVGRDEARFEEYAREKTGREFCDGDTVVTGLGLRLLHHFLTGKESSPAQIAATLEPDSETCQWFARFYGRAARNWALATVAWGGVFLCGGVAAKKSMLVTCPSFLEEFHAFSTYRDILQNIPVYLNRNEESGVYGAALQALQMLI